ncbi:MAG: hydrogenase 4 subunit F, partial [Atlantibacter hermannii]|nr:hydrogenase 4 subunit F [Atlantibacter hermannii]
MNDSTMFLWLLGVPLVAALLAFACRLLGDGARGVVTAVHTVAITALLGVSLWGVAQVYEYQDLLAAHQWLHLDSLSGLFLGLLGVVGFLTGLYSIGYMNHEVKSGELSVKSLCNYYGFFHLFIFTMLLVVTSNNLILMWAAIEATTLSST